MATAAIIITPLATGVTDAVKSGEIKRPHYVAIAIALLGFLAIIIAADVLARAIATSAKRRATAAERSVIASLAGAAQMMRFAKPIPAQHIVAGADPDLQVFATTSADTLYMLVKAADSDELGGFPPRRSP